MMDFYDGTFQNKCVLVTGAVGNLGCTLVSQLAHVGAAKVIAFDVVPAPPGFDTSSARTASVSDSNQSDADTEIASITGDVTDYESVRKATEGVDVVFHCASIIDIRPIPSSRMRRVNVGGTANVIRACVANGVRHLIYTSSLEVVCGDNRSYVGLLRGVPVSTGDEEDPFEEERYSYPRRHFLHYASSKVEAEKMILAANGTPLEKENGALRNANNTLTTVSLRPGYIVGAHCVGLKHEMMKAWGRRASPIGTTYVAYKYEYYPDGLVVGNISCVHVNNCAVAHILACVGLVREARETAEPPRTRTRRDAVAGQTFFLRDLDDALVNVQVNAMNGIKDRPIKLLLLNRNLTTVIVYLMDWHFRLMWCLRVLGSMMFNIFMRGDVSLSWTEPSASAKWYGDVVAAPAVQMVCREICFTGTRSREVLGYDVETQGKIASRAAYWSRYNGRGMTQRYDECTGEGKWNERQVNAGTVPGRIPLLSRAEIEEDMRRWADQFWAEIAKPTNASQAPVSSTSATEKLD
mmetsp:Transcript_25407/g.48492  ORF Transcript_25407/g.48492 Transcript_25407/m.48492 type:complete len:522 (-) Transcript_25407:1569-3134(-)